MHRLLWTTNRLLFQKLGNCCSRLLAQWAIHLWGKTSRPAWQSWEKQLIVDARQTHLPFNKHKIACYQWGDGSRKILLLPGWNSRASHFRNYITQLTALDYEVIGLDPIGHGLSSGNWTNIHQYLETIAVVVDRFGPFYATIGHSFGGFSIPFALQNHVFADRAVLLATPISLDWLLERFTRSIHATQVLTHRIRMLVEIMLGANCWHEYDIRQQAGKLHKVAVLVLHDEQDSGVPVSHAREIQHNWPGAELVLTQKLGHQRVLRHPRAVRAVVAFLQQA